MYPELLDRLRSCNERLRSLRDAVRADEVTARIRELEEKSAAPGFWGNKDRAHEIIAETNRLKAEVDPVLELSQAASDLLELAEIASDEDDDEGTAKEIERELEATENKLEELELRSTLNEPNDEANAFLELHAGAGGTEACDWANMLARMYRRFCERNEYKVELVDVVPAEEAGIRSMTYNIRGPYAYGFLKAERGVHRLVRISPFDAKNRRHTSFASIDVLPELPETSKEIEINPSELRVDTYRAGGAGGQHVNKVDSAVRITHLPTNTVVQCQNERSQHSNRRTAMRMLKAKLAALEEQKREEEFAKHQGDKSEIAFGSQIRSYVLHPYTIVKDLRTGRETGNAEAVLDGDIMPFIEEYLRKRRRERKAPVGR